MDSDNPDQTEYAQADVVLCCSHILQKRISTWRDWIIFNYF